MNWTKKRLRTILILQVELLALLVLRVTCSSLFVNTRQALSLIGMAAVLTMTITAAVVYRQTRRAGFCFCFIVLSYLFSFAQSMLVFAGERLPFSSFSITYSCFATDVLIDSAVFYLLSICMTAVGMCLAQKGMKEQRREAVVLSGEERIRRMGWRLMSISLAPTGYLLYRDILITLQDGYAATLEAQAGLAKICTLLSGLFMSGMVMVLCFERRRLFRLVFWVVFLMYCALDMAGGSRIGVFRMGVTVLMVKRIRFKDIKKSNIIAMLLLVGLLSFLFSIVSAVRIYLNTAENMTEFISDTANSIWKNNFLVAVLREMGNTQIINTLVYSECPRRVPYQFGLSYIKMLWGVLPNLIGKAYTGYIGVDIVFSPIYKQTSAGLGASYLAESYWNFGSFSPVACLCFGYFLGYVENRLVVACNAERHSVEEVFLLVYIMYYAVFLVRGEMLGFGRSVVYYAILPLLAGRIRFRGFRVKHHRILWHAAARMRLGRTDGRTL